MKMRHVMEMVGNARVVVENGKVVEVSDPEITWCALFEKARGIQKITPEEIRKNMEYRIATFGLFTPDRLLDDYEDFVGFGASETMMTGLKNGLIDASVSVCDGAGTVITDNPSLVQGMGARMSGLVETSPIPETVQKIKDRSGIVLDEKTAVIDPLAGAQKAAALGYRNIAVTTASAETAHALRLYEKESGGFSFIIIGVHTTGLSAEEARLMAENADIITLCASRCLRDVKPLLQVGTSVPLIALTQSGKELLLERAKYVNGSLLVNTMPLPYLPEQKQPR